MPRDLSLGNGTLLINFDPSYQFRDVYYPRVGQENQTAGHTSRFGVWVDGTFTWTTDAGWERRLLYKHDTLVTDVRLTHAVLGITLECNDAVDFHENVLLRRCTVVNHRPTPREVRLFYHHDFHLYTTDVGDTAYFDPHTNTQIHYKRNRYVLINGGVVQADPHDAAAAPTLQQGFAGWATGKKEVNGSEGTWRDAEDGVLGGNPIAQGSVDSTVQINLSVPPTSHPGPPPSDAPPADGWVSAFLWLCLGEDYKQVAALNKRVLERTPMALLTRTHDYWHLWANEQDFDYGELPERLVDLFKRSLLVVRTQIDNGGAVIASNDSDVVAYGQDTYSYMWPRDGALVTYALVLSGYRTTIHHFFEFCARVITGDGYFMHKYNPNGSLASSWHPWEVDGKLQLPIQEDETALVISTLWQWFQHARNVEDVKPWYRPLIIAAANFMATYRDPETGLPQESYDLWEERRGVPAWTVGAVYAGLTGAANFADAFGETEAGARYREAAKEIKAAVERYLYHNELGRFVRMVSRRADGTLEQDLTLDASMIGLFYFGMFPADDDRIVRTMEAIRSALWVNTPIGGLARYEHDHYQQQSDEVPGNPWFICTLWLAQWLIARACTEAELEDALPLLEWVADRALPSGILAEQVHPFTGAPLSVSPLTWSHATYAATVVEYLDRKGELNTDPTTGTPLYFRERRSIRTQHQHHATIKKIGVAAPPRPEDPKT